jgi:hypothetical protein
VGAIINSIYQGQTTGVVLARAIFGLTNPGARLPITYYKNISNTGSLQVGEGCIYIQWLLVVHIHTVIASGAYTYSGC